jgi:hypothetical protein
VAVSKPNAEFKAAIERAIANSGLKHPPASVADVAGLFGISSTAFYKFKSGERFVTQSTAQKMANSWQKKAKKDDAERDALITEFMATVPKPDAGNAEACAWIEARERNKSVVVGEFRDLPVARPTGPHDDLADNMGRAVARGVVYAMVLPFSISWIGAPVPLRLRNYLSSMCSFVGDAYQNLLGRTFAAVVKDYIAKKEPGAATDESALKEQLLEARKRLRLYVLKDETDKAGQIGKCPGFASKVFLVRDRNSQPEVWIWVSTQTGERVLCKKSDESEILALESRFYPILECFRANNGLPMTNELDSYVKDDDTVDLLGGSSDQPQSPWKEFELSERLIERMMAREIHDNTGIQGVE